VTHLIHDSAPAAYGRFTNGPASNTNVLGRDGVSQPSETTSDTLETCLRKTITRVDQSARGAGARSIVGVDVDHRYSRQSRFVGDEPAQLIERPRVQYAPLRPPSLDPRANAFEIFEGKSSLRAFGHAHQAFADRMVDVRSEALLFLPTSTQQSLGRAGLFPLESSAQSAVPTPQAIDVATREQVAVAGGSDVFDAKVDAEVFVHLDCGWFDRTHGGQQIPLARAADQVALTPPRGEQATLSGATREGYALPTTGGPDRDISAGETQDAVVVGDAAERPESSLLRMVDLVSIGHFGNQTDHDLSREREPLACLGVNQFVQRVLAERALPPCPSTDHIGCRVGLTDRLAQHRGLLGRGQQLERNDQPHASMYQSTEHLFGN
jgi:hypothetical protein